MNKTSKVVITTILSDKLDAIPTRKERDAITEKYFRMENALRECAKTENITFMRQRQIAKEAFSFDPLA